MITSDFYLNTFDLLPNIEYETIITFIQNVFGMYRNADTSVICKKWLNLYKMNAANNVWLSDV